MTRPTIAQAIADRLRSADARQEDGGLIAYAERLAKRREGSRALAMGHLAPLARSYERVELALRSAAANSNATPVFECHHAPVQHGKTTLIQSAILRLLRRNPRAWIAYATYNEDTAVAKMYEVRQLAIGEGISIDPDFDTGKEFRTKEGGGVLCGGIVGGPWTSRGFDLIIVDDPYKTAQDAYSVAWRSAVEAAFWTALWTRRRLWTSIIVNAARWHPNDLTGTLIKKGWKYVCLSAISKEGDALWPDRWPLHELLAIRDGRPANDNAEAIDPIPATVWASLYQGQPNPDGGKKFDPATWPRYDVLPTGTWVEAMGADFAYGGKDRNDHSAYAIGRRYSGDRRIYIVEADDRAEGIELYGCRTAEAQIRRGGGPRLIVPQSAAHIDQDWRPQLAREDVKLAHRIPCRWYTSTTEAGVAALLTGYGARVDARRAAVDKLARVQAGGYQSAASEGRIVVPSNASPGILSFLRAHDEFTGFEGDFDDPVDAGCAMHDLLALPVGGLGGGRAWGGGGGDWEGSGGGGQGGRTSGRGSGYDAGAGETGESEWD